MRPTRLFTVAGALALVIGPVAVFVQYVVTPLGTTTDPATIVDQAARHHSAMAWALGLDVPCLLVIPAVLFAGYLAGSRTSVLAGLATGLCLVPAIGGVVLFANDAVVFEASTLPDRGAAVSIVDGYENNLMVGGLTVVYLATHVVGFVLLAVALRRARAVGVVAAGSLALWPLGEMTGYAIGVKPVALIGYGLLVVGYLACARQLVRGAGLNADSSTPELERAPSF